MQLEIKSNIYYLLCELRFFYITKKDSAFFKDSSVVGQLPKGPIFLALPPA
jgi:hypothetical protein